MARSNSEVMISAVVVGGSCSKTGRVGGWGRWGCQAMGALAWAGYALDIPEDGRDVSLLTENTAMNKNRVPSMGAWRPQIFRKHTSYF